MVPRQRDQNTKEKEREREREIERPCGSENCVWNCDSLVCIYIETASQRDKDFFSYLVFGLGLFIFCFNFCFLMLNWIS